MSCSIVFHRKLLFIVGFLSLVSLLVLGSGGPHSGPNTQAWCYNNLRKIDAAKQQLALELGLTNGSVVTLQQISKYINGGSESLKCFDGGTYIIGPIGTEPRCTIHGSESKMENGWKQEMNK